MHLKSGSDLVAMDKNGEHIPAPKSLPCAHHHYHYHYHHHTHTITIILPTSLCLIKHWSQCTATAARNFFCLLSLPQDWSDPYVKFKVGGRLLHKSRTIHRDLNPCGTRSSSCPSRTLPADYRQGESGEVLGVTCQALQKSWALFYTKRNFGE